MEKLTIVKVGGKIVEEPESLNQLLSDFAQIQGHKLLVHGGGRSATRIAEKLGIESRMIDGRRITDEATLQVVVMVYGGLVNKNIVAALQSRQINALGLTGADLDLIKSDKRPVKEIDYGFVGDVKEVNAHPLVRMIEKNIVPVIAPISHDGKGNLLNTNADTIAAETAQALASFFDVSLIYCFEKKGVLIDENDDESVIPFISKEEFTRLTKEGVIKGGMLPKLENAFRSVDKGVKEVIITKASEINKGTGTTIV
jgi:acetylglutamate kinase